MRRRRFIVFTAMFALIACPVPTTASPAIIDSTVRFSVENVNTSLVPCSSDGGRYTVVGNLVAPRGRQAFATRATTLYVSGSGGASTWHFPLDGYDYAAEQARKGLVSVAIDLLGYGGSGIPNGNDICFGSLADVVHQVIGHLRRGDYQADGTKPVAFEHVALAGHSGGGTIVEIESYSFHDIDALIVASYQDYGFGVDGYPFAGQFGAKCAAGGEPKWAGAADGYAFLFKSQVSYLFFNADQAAIDAFDSRYERDNCGAASSFGQAIAMNEEGVATLSVPVLLVFGDHDIWPPLSPELQRARFRSSSDVSLVTIQNAGHMLMLQRTAPGFRSVMSSWLKERGF
jgi:pimeloyl-ACP methyl ester carboxylesterase